MKCLQIIFKSAIDLQFHTVTLFGCENYKILRYLLEIGILDVKFECDPLLSGALELALDHRLFVGKNGESDAAHVIAPAPSDFLPGGVLRLRITVRRSILRLLRAGRRHHVVVLLRLRQKLLTSSLKKYYS
jgi:hypothetical protein